jgi:hypothetical protein
MPEQLALTADEQKSEVSQLPPPPDIDKIMAIVKNYRLEIHGP